MERAVIVSKLDDYHFRVRVPRINKAQDVPGATPSNELYIATVSTLPGIKPNYNINDVVFVEFENEDLTVPVIAGLLDNDNARKEGNHNANIAECIITDKAVLPEEASIGAVSSSDIKLLNELSDSLKDDYDLTSEAFLNNVNLAVLDPFIKNQGFNSLKQLLGEQKRFNYQLYNLMQNMIDPFLASINYISFSTAYTISEFNPYYLRATTGLISGFRSICIQYQCVHHSIKFSNTSSFTPTIKISPFNSDVLIEVKQIDAATNETEVLEDDGNFTYFMEFSTSSGGTLIVTLQNDPYVKEYQFDIAFTQN